MKKKIIYGLLAAMAVGIAIANITEDPHKKSVNADQFGEDWPLTVPSGEIACRNGGEAIFITNSEIYALNGIAKRIEIARQIEEISKPHKMFDDITMSSQPLIDAALKLC